MAQGVPITCRFYRKGEEQWGESLFFQGDALSRSSPPLRRAEPRDSLLGSGMLQHAQEDSAQECLLCQTASFTLLGDFQVEMETCTGQHHISCKSFMKLFRENALKHPWGAATEIIALPPFHFP